MPNNEFTPFVVKTGVNAISRFFEQAGMPAHAQNVYMRAGENLLAAAKILFDRAAKENLVCAPLITGAYKVRPVPRMDHVPSSFPVVTCVWPVGGSSISMTGLITEDNYTLLPVSVSSRIAVPIQNYRRLTDTFLNRMQGFKGAEIFASDPNNNPNQYTVALVGSLPKLAEAFVAAQIEYMGQARRLHITRRTTAPSPAR